MDRLKVFALDVLALIIAIILGGVSFFILGGVVYSIISMVGEAIQAKIFLSSVLFFIGMIIFIIVTVLGTSWAMEFVDERYYKWKRKRKKADK